MRVLYVDSLRIAVRHWGVVLFLFAVSLLGGLVCTAATWTWLSVTLERSLATRTLLTDLDPNVFVDLFVHHRESFWMLLVAAAIVALALMLLWIWINAVAIVAVGDGVPLGHAARRGFELYPRFAALWVLTMALSAGALLLGGAAAEALVWATRDGAVEWERSWGLGGGVLAGLAFFLCMSAVHDHARIHTAATGASALRSLAWALWFVFRAETRALPLLALLLSNGIAVWAVYQSIARAVPTDFMPGVVVSLCWGEAFVLARQLLRVWTFAAETELQNAHDVTQASDAGRWA